MKNLYQILCDEIERWRKSGYQSQFSEVVEILKFNKNESKYLRTAQFNAIETYLFLRFVKETPKIIDLYKEYFKNLKDFVEVIGIKHINQDNIRFLKTLDEVLKDLPNPAVAQYKYDALIETLNLDYPSYILALAMGSGKTNIISAIIAIEFAIAIANENKKLEFNFIKNALVFAPGLTILKNSLKNIALLPFAKIFPLIC